MSGNARIDATRLWQSLMDMAAIGATAKGGVHRIAFSEEDRQARDLI
jgi:beta-ureidopropionase / N-carbamoyl-L-amino-acid hydrolase